MTGRRRTFAGELVEAAVIAALSVAVALVGDPQPLAILVAIAGGLTAAYIAVVAVDRHRGPR